MKLKLMTKIKNEDEMEKLKNQCVFCKESIMVMCGTPTVHWGGCCVGFQTPTKRILASRKAHTWCYLEWLEKNKKITIIK